MEISSPANNEQGDETASPVSNNDLLKQLVVAHNSMSHQLTALSSQMTEQTLLLRGVLDEMRQQRDHKERMNALKRRKKEHSLAAIGVSLQKLGNTDSKNAHDFHNSEHPNVALAENTEIDLQQHLSFYLCNNCSRSFGRLYVCL